MNQSDVSLRGVFPPIPTPFDTGGEVAHLALTENLELWDQYDLSGYVVLGSNGEAVYLTEEERRRVWEAARRAIPAHKLMIAGTGCESTRQTVALARRAAQAGADATLVVTPHYYDGKMTAEGLIDHFHTVADRVSIPVVLYNVPKFTHVDMDASTVARAARHPNVIGIKDSGGDVAKLADVVRTTGPDFQVLAGSASFFFAALALGAVGGVLALSNVAPQQCLDVFRLFNAGQWDEAAELQRRMIPVNASVTARFGIAGLKAALDMLGYYGGPVRPPLRGLTERERQTLRGILVEGEILRNR